MSLPQPQVEMLDLYRAGLKSAADLMKTSLENAERLQNQQLVAIRTAIVDQTKSASELGQAKSLDELMAFQTRLAGAQIERAIGLWASMWQAAGESQMAAIGQVQNQMAQAREWLTDAAGAQAGVRQGPAQKEHQRKSA